MTTVWTRRNAGNDYTVFNKQNGLAQPNDKPRSVPKNSSFFGRSPIFSLKLRAAFRRKLFIKLNIAYLFFPINQFYPTVPTNRVFSKTQEKKQKRPRKPCKKTASLHNYRRRSFSRKNSPNDVLSSFRTRSARRFGRFFSPRPLEPLCRKILVSIFVPRPGEASR